MVGIPFTFVPKTSGGTVDLPKFKCVTFSDASQMSKLTVDMIESFNSMFKMYDKYGLLDTTPLSIFSGKSMNADYMFNYCSAGSYDFSGMRDVTITSATGMFDSVRVESLDMSDIKFGKLSSCSSMFGSLYSDNTYLKSITNLRVEEECTASQYSQPIAKLSNLEHFTVTGNTFGITYLNMSATGLGHDGLIEFFNSLPDNVTNGATWTVTINLGSTKLGLLSDDEKASVSAKGYTLQ